MKTGIIVHSNTGNTYSVAQKIQEKLSSQGRSSEIVRVNQAGSKDIPVDPPPDISGYDALIFGAPVHAFALSRLMSAYMGQIPVLEGKRVFCYVTMGLKLPLFGGGRAVSRMKKLSQSKGAEVCGSGIVCWSSKKRDKMTDETAEKAVQLL